MILVTQNTWAINYEEIPKDIRSKRSPEEFYSVESFWNWALELNSKNEQDSSKLVENPFQDDPLSEQELALENVVDQTEPVKNPVQNDPLPEQNSAPVNVIDQIELVENSVPDDQVTN